MIVESEPNGLLMVRYKLYFNQQRPDPEDAWVVAYLTEHGLEPRRELYEEHEGVPYKVWHFGQCYLQHHVAELGALYKKGVEYSVLAHHIREALGSADEDAVRAAAEALDETAIYDVSMALAAQLHAQAHFEAGENERLAVRIASEQISEAFLAQHSTAS